VLGAGLVAAISLAVAGDHPLAGAWASPTAAFWFVTIAAGLCLPLAAAVLGIGWRQATAELAIVGAALTVLSAWSFVHGLTVPGYLYGQNAATDVAALLALPAALAVAAPTVLADRGLGRRIAAHWRAWCVGTLIATAGGVTVVLARAAALRVTNEGVLSGVAAVSVFAGVTLLARRHYHLYLIGRRRASLAAAASIGYLGIAGLLGLLAAPASPA